MGRFDGTEWPSYDSAAATHDRLAVPSVFAPTAKDLVARMDMRAALAILDVGAGSGVAARLVAEAADAKTVVLALDPSVEMLRIARSHGVVSVVGGGLPELPFSAAKFWRRKAMGVTTWGAVENEFRDNGNS